MQTAGDVIQWLSALGALTFLGTLITVLSTRRKVKGDTASVLTQSALTLLEPMKKELAETQEEVTELKAEVVELRTLVRRLVIELGEYRALTTGEQKIIRGY